MSTYDLTINASGSEAVRKSHPHRDAKWVVSFKGMVNFFNMCVPNLADIAASMNYLRKKGVKISGVIDKKRL